MKEAIEKSNKQAYAIQRDQKKHERRLDRLLASNGLKYVDVPSDGNCFFSTIAIQMSEILGETLDSNDVRERVWTEITKNFVLYEEYLSGCEQSNMYTVMLSGLWDNGIMT